MIDASVLSQLSRCEKESIYAEICRRESEYRKIDIVEKYRDDPLGFITEGMRQCRGDSWRTWRIILKAAYGVPLPDDELETFREVAHRDPPPGRVKELWLIIGARGGKDSVASMIATQMACYADEGRALRPGERALVACFATDLKQAGIIYNYTRAYFESVPSLRRKVRSSLEGTRPRPIVLDNDTEIQIVTNNFRATRGWAYACVIFDECAFWRDESSATPDKETYTAVLRGTDQNTMIIGISTPYKQSGLLYEKWKKHYGENGTDDILVVQAPTTTFRPTFDRSIIERAMEEDPENARAEYLAEWRRDLADYVDREIAEAAVLRGIALIPFAPKTHYTAFTDPSGGARDSFTLAIAHEEHGRGVLDLLREVRAPFQPSAVVADYAKTLKNYGLRRVTGDHYAGEWPSDAFREHGIQYEISELTKNDIYREFLPHLNSAKVDLLDNQRLINQLCGLERRTIRGGRDSVDHAPLAHDDLINAVAGALTLVLDATSRPMVIPPDILQRAAFR
jgi:hypothetical protein